MLNREKLKTYIESCKDKEMPKVTISMSTNRKAPESDMDSTRYKNLLQDVKKKLEENYPRRDWQNSLDKLSTLSNDSMFWKESKDGLVVIACGDDMEIFKLDYSVPELAVVSDTFHLKPLFYFDQIFGDYYLADLSRDRVSLYEVGKNGIEELKGIDIKTSFIELFDDFDADSNLNVGSYGGSNASHHGHRARAEEVEKDRVKYFQYLDSSFDKLSKETGKQFILAGITENISKFKGLSKGKYLTDYSIDKPLSSLDLEKLKSEISEVIKPAKKRELESIETEVVRAKNSDKFMDSVVEISKALAEGRVEKIILMEDITGTVNTDADEIAIEALMGGTEITALKRDMIDFEERIMALLRY